MKVVAQTVMGKLVPELYPVSNFSVVYNHVREIQSYDRQPNHTPSRTQKKYSKLSPQRESQSICQEATQREVGLLFLGPLEIRSLKFFRTAGSNMRRECNVQHDFCKSRFICEVSLFLWYCAAAQFFLISHSDERWIVEQVTWRWWKCF